VAEVAVSVVALLVAVVVWGVVVMVLDEDVVMVILVVEKDAVLVYVVVTHTVDSRKAQYTGHTPVEAVLARISSQE
jgi:hypothetical protein